MNIILSIDYEVFGDGTGSMSACMLRPLNVMLDLTSKYNALLSVFVETMEIQTLQSSIKYKTETDNICQQLQTACKDGHDLQLHLHPQWQGANFTNNQLSELKADKWRIGNLSKEEINQIVKDGKQWLEELLKPVDANYNCIAFRAGGWCIQPSTDVIEVLQENNILIDTSVAPGSKNKAKAEWYDFSDAPQDKAYWKSDTDILIPSAKGVYELPITTGKTSKFNHFKVCFTSLFRNTIAKNCIGSYSIPGVRESRLFSKLRKMSTLGHVMLDISTMPAETLIEVTKQWQEKFKNDPNSTIVAIGHTKNFTEKSALELEKYLQWAEKQNHQFITYQQWLKKKNH